MGGRGKAASPRRLLNHTHPDYVCQLFYIFDDVLLYPGAQIYQSIGVISLGLVAHVLHVYTVLAQKRCDVCQHGRHVPVDNAHPHDAAAL